MDAQWSWTHDGSVALSTPELLGRGLAIDGGANILAVSALQQLRCAHECVVSWSALGTSLLR
jgi:hypothetical protein